MATPARGFEWFVAWRHLRDPERRSHRMLIFGGTIMVLSIAALVVAHFLGRPVRSAEGLLQLRSTVLADNVRLGGIIGLGVGAACTYLGVLLAWFTLFTALSTGGVTLGTFLPIVTLSVMSGFEADLKTKIRGAKADVVVTKTDDAEFTEWQTVQRRLADIPGVVASTPYLEAEVMVQAGNSAMGIVVRGIDPVTASSVLDLENQLRDGKLSYLAKPEHIPEFPHRRVDPPHDDLDRQDAADKEKAKERARDEAKEPRRGLPAIVLGEELYARTLRVFQGSEIDVICPICRLTPAGPGPGLKSFRVAGHFYSGMYEYDSKLAYVSLPEMQQFLEMPGEVTGLDVRTAAPEQARAIADAASARLGPGYEVRTWEDLNTGLFRALRLEKIAMFVALAFIALVASFSVIGTLIMSVTGKAREVAILKAMGATDGAIRRIFFAEGLYIGLLGSIVGVASGISTCKLMLRYGLPLPTDVYYITELPVLMRSGEIASVAALVLLLCCLATVYPALIASRLRPVAGLRYE